MAPAESSRDLALLTMSYKHLLDGVAARDPHSKTRAENLALLTAPLGRPRKDSEAIVFVDDIYNLISGGRDDAMVRTQIRTAYGKPLFDLKGGYLMLDDAFVGRDGFVSWENKLLIDRIQVTFVDWRNGDESRWFYTNGYFSAFCPADGTCVFDRAGPRRDVPAFLFATQNAYTNFGHFVHDFMTQIRVYHDIKKYNPDIVCLFGRQFVYPMQRLIINEIFRTEMSENKVRYIDNRIGWYNKLFIPYPQFLGDFDAVGFESARYARKLLSHCAAKNVSPSVDTVSRRIFVSRRDSTLKLYNRDEIDHAHIEKVFADLGFEVVVITELRIEEVLEKFYNSEIVAGIHGAGLLNVLFSRSESPLLIELSPLVSSWRSIERTVLGAGVRYSYIAPTMKGDVAEFPDLEAQVRAAIGGAE